MSRVQIKIVGDKAHIFSKYNPERVEILRDIPFRRWDKDGKFWEIPAGEVEQLRARLTGRGDTVFDDVPCDDSRHDAERARWQAEYAGLEHGYKVLQGQNKRLRQDILALKANGAVSGQSWAEHLLGRLDAAQADEVYRALSRVLHPDGDAGGDTELMDVLDAAHDLLSTRTW